VSDATGATSQIPFTPLSDEAMARLEPAERLAFTTAASQVAREENPGINTTTALVLTIHRLIGDGTAGADPAEPVIELEHRLGEALRKAESLAMDPDPVVAQAGRQMLAVLGVDDFPPPIGIGAGAAMIEAERLRQVAVEGYDAEHDRAHEPGTLAAAAAAYVLNATGDTDGPWLLWPFAPVGFKPGPKPLDSLVKAGALIAAEIDRIIAEEARRG